MMNSLRNALVLAAVALLALPMTAMAQSDQPERPLRAAGEVLDVDAAAGQFTMLTRSDQRLDVFVSSSTRFRSPDGSLQGLDDVEVGMHVLAAGRRVAGGLAARLVADLSQHDRPDLNRFAGEIIRIEADGRHFVLRNAAGEELTLTVTDASRFHKPNAEISGLADLEIGMHALTVYRVDGDANLALRVLVRGRIDRPDRPRPDIRVRGHIRAISSTSVTIESLEGRSVTMAITEDTVLRGGGDGGLDVGDAALAAGTELEGGRIAALLVVARGDRHGHGRDALRAPQRRAPDGRPFNGQGRPPLGPEPQKH